MAIIGDLIAMFWSASLGGFPLAVSGPEVTVQMVGEGGHGFTNCFCFGEVGFGLTVAATLLCRQDCSGRFDVM